MKKKNPDKAQTKAPPESGLEVIRQLIKKQELQTTILKKLIEKTKQTSSNT
jgi:hypothetical protein